MENKSEIKYINTLSYSLSALTDMMGELIGYNSAQIMSKSWYEKYNEFLLNVTTGEIVMFKKRTNGFWEPVQHELVKLS